MRGPHLDLLTALDLGPIVGQHTIHEGRHHLRDIDTALATVTR